MLRYDNIVFGVKPKLVEFRNCPNSGLPSVTDDSHFVPRVKSVRDFVASGGKVSDSLGYDFNDGVDNGYTPQLRALRPDPADIDNAARAVLEEASKAAADKAAADKAAADKAAADKAAADKAAAEKAATSKVSSAQE